MQAVARLRGFSLMEVMIGDRNRFRGFEATRA